MSKEGWGLLAECEKRKGHALKCASQDADDIQWGKKSDFSI